jgi:hypothetical protein
MPGSDEPDTIVREFREHRTVPRDATLKRLLQAYARPDSQLESIFVELKEQFSGDAEAWLNLERQLAAFGNSGGGIMIFGLASDHRRVGLATSLVSQFDPINITQKLQRHAPEALIATAYTELFQYNKRYGFLLIGRSESITIFDKPGNVQPAQGRQKPVLVPGVVYVRTEGASREARQSDIDRLVNERLNIGLSAFLARIERVAELPPNSELLARTPGSSRGYVLVSSGQGVPVTISQEDAGVVPLAEVLTPEAPLSSLNAEVVGQLRQWHADNVHRVARPILMRWYLGRSTFTPMSDRAEFCFLSALHDWGYPMYWASQMERARLEEVLRHQFEIKAYPDNRVLAYVIGAFFFSRRVEILADLRPHLPREQANVVDRLKDCPDACTYLTSGRICTTTVRIGPKYYDLSKVMNERDTTGQELFDQLMRHYSEGNVPDSQRLVAHQLDMLVHGDLDS